MFLSLCAHSRNETFSVLLLVRCMHLPAIPPKSETSLKRPPFQAETATRGNSLQTTGSCRCVQILLTRCSLFPAYTLPEGLGQSSQQEYGTLELKLKIVRRRRNLGEQKNQMREYATLASHVPLIDLRYKARRSGTSRPLLFHPDPFSSKMEAEPYGKYSSLFPNIDKPPADIRSL